MKPIDSSRGEALADKSLFRKKSLDRLSSPEEHDRLIVVSRSGLWLSLLAAIVLIITSLLWGWFGRVDDQIIAEGIVTHSIQDNSEDDRTLLVYGSPFKGQRVQVGMDVRFFPSFTSEEVYGYISGRVTDVNPWPRGRKELMDQLSSEELAELFIKLAGGPPILIRVRLDQDSNTPSGLKWSSGSGPDLKVPPGSLGRTEITIKRQRPLALVVPWLKGL